MTAAPGHSTFARRNELAQQRGFRSYGEQRRFSATINSRASLAALSSSARETRQTALQVLAVARRDGSDVTEVARRQGVDMQAVSWWVGDAVQRRGGQWHVSAADRLFRPMYVYSNGKLVDVDVRGSRAASKIASYHAAVATFLNSGDDSALAKFQGVRVGGVELETDLDVLESMGRRGEFDFADIYRMVEL